MRTILLLPLTALVAVVAGCGSGASEQKTGSLPERDLTLASQTAQVEIASPVETQRVPSQRRTVRHPPSSRQPASPEPTSANDRELLPGKTVTLIPVSSGPSAGPDETGELPAVRGTTMVVHGGGTCRGGRRGPGIGIATAPRPDFR